MGEDTVLKAAGGFQEFYERNVELTYRMCLVYLRNQADAEDAVQSVFLKYLQSPVAFSGRDHERAWLLTAAKNQCRDVLKSWWRRRRVDHDVLRGAAAGEESGQADEILAALLALPEKYRTVLYLHCIEGYSEREVAVLLGRNESTVRSQLLRGRRKLRDDLGGDGDD